MILKNNFLLSDAVQTLEFLVVAMMTVLCCIATFSLFFSLFTANVGQNTQVCRNYATPHKTQMIDTTINLLVNQMECTNLSSTTLMLRLAVKSDNSSPAILFRDSEKLDAAIKLSLTLPTLCTNEGNFGLRLTSLDPLEVPNKLVDVVANSNRKICPHFHLSAQSAEDSVLKLMAHQHHVSHMFHVCEYIKEKMPHTNVGSDIIVGFPGETAEQFETTFNNPEACPMDYFPVFSYSKNRGMPAATFENEVPEPEKKQ